MTKKKSESKDEKKSKELKDRADEKRTAEAGKHFQGQGTEKQG
jgi:hypothetical protein